jgi:mRNA interferase MazF
VETGKPDRTGSQLIVLDQIRTLDRARLIKRVGALRPPTLAATLGALQAMFAP